MGSVIKMFQYSKRSREMTRLKNQKKMRLACMRMKVYRMLQRNLYNSKGHVSQLVRGDCQKDLHGTWVM